MQDSLTWLRARLDAGEDLEVWEDPDLIERCVDLQAHTPALFDEVERRVRGALSGRAAVAWLSRITRKLKERDKARAAKRQAEQVAVTKAQLEERGIPSFALGDDAEIGLELYRRLSQEHDGPILADFGRNRSKQLWRWEREAGIYKPFTEEELRVRIMGWSGAMVGEDGKQLALNEGRIRGIVAAAHAYAATEHGYEAEFFASVPDGVTFENAFVTLNAARDDVITEPLSHGQRQRWALPFGYDPKASHERWDKFLDEVLGDQAALAALQEFVGACLLGLAGQAGVALVLLGAGANGKSTVLKIIRRLFGADAVSVPPQVWHDDPKTVCFASARINVVEELPAADVMASSDFKAIVTSALITRRPLYQEPLTFVARPGHIFAANELPYAPDPTHGFWRKWMVLRFDRQWDTDGTRPDLPPADPTLEDQLVDELQGIATWAAIGAKRFVLQGRRLTRVEQSVEAVAEWRHDSDRVAQWIEERCEPSRSSHWTPGKVLYANYRSWCGENGYSPYNVMRWGTAVSRLGHKKKRNNGVKIALDLAGSQGTF